MNIWLENEIKRLLDGNNYWNGVPSQYAKKKAKLLEKFRWFQAFALKRQMEELQRQETLEKSLKAQGGFTYSDLHYTRVFNKPFKIAIIKEILKHTK